MNRTETIYVPIPFSFSPLDDTTITVNHVESNCSCLDTPIRGVKDDDDLSGWNNRNRHPD